MNNDEKNLYFEMQNFLFSFFFFFIFFFLIQWIQSNIQNAQFFFLIALDVFFVVFVLLIYCENIH